MWCFFIFVSVTAILEPKMAAIYLKSTAYLNDGMFKHYSFKAQLNFQSTTNTFKAQLKPRYHWKITLQFKMNHLWSYFDLLSSKKWTCTTGVIFLFSKNMMLLILLLMINTLSQIKGINLHFSDEGLDWRYPLLCIHIMKATILKYKMATIHKSNYFINTNDI